MDNSLASNPVALNKYRVAAQICNEVLGQICKRARVAGTPISTLCEFGDQLIVELVRKKNIVLLIFCRPLKYSPKAKV